ncbi:MFS transporter [Pseudonocardia spinosispora]|uniref:uridine transporter UriT n=1 Tax=Pseudonocardia spinosispora TaxID=103441 RepID=UPI000687337F|nr:MFS transporter [Pseudonocardia spinosispora]
MTALLSACIAFQLNATMMSPVLPTMARELGTDEVAVGLSQTMFFTSGAIFGVFLPRLSDIRGRRLVLGGLLALVAVGSVLGALAPNIVVLDIARIIQGCSGPVVPICLLMLRASVTEPKRYGTLMGVITAVNGGVAGVDAYFGGLLATHFGFRGVFWTMTVIALIATAVVFAWTPESRPSEGVAMDWWGVVPLVLSVAAILTSVNEAGKLGSANWPLVAGLLVLGVGFFVLFYRVEKGRPHPLVSPEQLRKRETWALLLTTLLTMTGIFATINGLAVTFAQDTHAGFGLRPDVSSLLLLTPFALVGWLVGPFAGRMAPALGYRRVLRLGMVGSIVSLAIMATFGLHSLPMLVVASVLLGITYAGVVNIMLNGLGIVLSHPENPGFLPGMNSAAFNFGAGLSFAVLPVVQVFGSPSGSSSSAGYTGGLLLGLVITGCALAVSYLIPRPAAAETSGGQL